MHKLRWQLLVALAGLASIAGLLVFVSERVVHERPARGGRFVEAVVGRPQTYFPLLARSDAELSLSRLVFSGLTRQNPSEPGTFVPDLAERIEISADGRSYTFYLRQSARWHDGRPVTAEDVRFTVELLQSPELPDFEKIRLAEAWQNVDVESLDPHTVRLGLAEPYAPFLSATTLPIVPAHILSGIPHTEIARHRAATLAPVGSGPFRLEARGEGGFESDRLLRFEGHWDREAGPAYLDEIELRYFETIAEAIGALGRREVQGMGGVPADALVELGEDLQIFSAVRSGVVTVLLNPSAPILRNRSVRQALSLAIDRQAIIDWAGIFGGEGVPADGPIPAGSWAYPDTSSQQIGGDPARAETVLDEAGWIDGDEDGIRDRDGLPLQVALSTPADDPLLGPLSERLQEDWQRIGISVTLQPLAAQNVAGTLNQRAFEAFLLDLDQPFPDPDPYAFWHSSQIASPGLNYTGFSNPEADGHLLAARRAHPVKDRDQRIEAYHAFLRILREEQPAIHIAYPVYNYVVADPGLANVQIPPLIVEPADRFLTVRSWFGHTTPALDPLP